MPEFLPSKWLQLVQRPWVFARWSHCRVRKILNGPYCTQSYSARLEDKLTWLRPAPVSQRHNINSDCCSSAVCWLVRRDILISSFHFISFQLSTCSDHDNIQTLPHKQDTTTNNWNVFHGRNGVQRGYLHRQSVQVHCFVSLERWWEMIGSDFYAFVCSNMSVKYLKEVGNGDNGDASLFLLYSGCRPHKNAFSKYANWVVCQLNNGWMVWRLGK